MAGFDEHHLDATVADLERAAGQRDETPRWLTGLIAKHGQPVVTRSVHDGGNRTVYTWLHLNMSVLIGDRWWGDHYVIADSGTRTAETLADKPPTDADISAVVALAGLCDAPEVTR